jgi:hypothetical protein
MAGIRARDVLRLWNMVRDRLRKEAVKEPWLVLSPKLSKAVRVRD